MTNNGPELTRRAPLDVAILCYPGAQATCIHGLTDLFTYADHFARMRAADLPDSTPRPAAAREEAFLRVTPWRQASRDADFDCDAFAPGRRPSVVIVPAYQLGPPEQHFSPRMAALIARCHEQGIVLGAVCGGVFLLAEAGVLGGRSATTHWMFAAELQRRFPAVRVDADRLVIDDRDIVTAGGVLAWADMGLTLVGRLLGRTVMASTARFMLMDPPRREQRVYAEFHPTLTHGDAVVLAIQHWLHANASIAASSGALAARARLGARTFLRRFAKATGMTPGEYQQRLRMTRGRELLESSRRTIEQIALATGYEDPRSLRRIFKRTIGVSPAEYRRRFRRDVAAQQPAPLWNAGSNEIGVR